MDERAEDPEPAGPERPGLALAPSPSAALLRGAPLLLALLALVAWAGSAVRGGFAYDDKEVLFGNPVVAGELPLSSAFDRDYWHHIEDAGHWRPAATLSLRLDHLVHGADAHGCHATNVALHALVVALAALVAARLARALGAAFPWFGLALFAVHPLLADSVAWISGRTSMLSALGGLLGALGVGAAASASRAGAGRTGVGRTVAWAHGPRARALGVTSAAFGGVALALMGKEDGLVFVVVLPLVALAHAPHEARGRVVAATLAGSALAVGAWLMARHVALGSSLPSAPHALLADEPLALRLAHGLAAWGEGLAAAFLPLLALPPNLTVADVGGPHLAGRVALFAALCVGALVLGWRGQLRALRAPERAAWGLRSDRALGSARFVLGSAFGALASIAPHLQVVPSGELFAPRFLYLPLLLGAPALSAALRVLVPRAGPRASVATAAVALCIALAQAHAARYASREAYWEAHLPRHASDPRVWNELGNAARERGDVTAATKSFERATELAPRYSRAWVNLGTLALARGDLDAAREHLTRAVQCGRENPAAHANLGNVLARLERHAEAAAAYRCAVELAPGRVAFQRGLARALKRSGDLEGARAAVREALAKAPKDTASRALARELGLP